MILTYSDASKNKLSKNLTIEGAIDAIHDFEQDNGLSASSVAVKLKSYTNQVLIAGENFVYKIYESDEKVLTIDHFARHCLAKIYSELGITWNLISFKRDGEVFDFQQRQKLRVASPEKDGPFGNVLASYAEINDQVEKMLHFDLILEQLKKWPEFQNVKTLKLIRAAINKFNDYAFFKSQAVLLDDAEFCVVLLDEDNQILDVECNHEVLIKTPDGKFHFQKLGLLRSVPDGNISPLKRIDEIFKGWDLIYIPEQNKSITSRDSKVLSSQLLTQEEADVALDLQLSCDCSENIEHLDVTSQHKTSPKASVFKSNLTDGTEEELYEVLFESHLDATDLRVITEFNPNGEMLGKQEFIIWASHMKTISSFYPQVEKTTIIQATQEFCKLYLDGVFDIRHFSGRYSTEVNIVPPKTSETFPERCLFRKLLIKLFKNDPIVLKNFLSSASSIEEPSKRNKASLTPCEKHNRGESRYSDSDACMMCDFEQISTSLLS